MVTNFEKQESKQIQIAVCYKPTYHSDLGLCIPVVDTQL